MLNYNLIISNLNYYICIKDIQRTWLWEMTDIPMKEINNMLGYRFTINEYFKSNLNEIIDVLDLDLKELTDDKFKENLNEKVGLEDFRNKYLDVIFDMKNIGNIRDEINEVIYNKENDWKIKVHRGIQDIRELCDEIENRI